MRMIITKKVSLDIRDISDYRQQECEDYVSDRKENRKKLKKSYQCRWYYGKLRLILGGPLSLEAEGGIAEIIESIRVD